MLSCLIGITTLAQNIEFIENKGQWDSHVKYMGQLSNGAFFVQQNGYTVLQHHGQDWDTHVDNFGAMKNTLLPPMDRAVSTLLNSSNPACRFA